jgi:hypothetical protein
MEICTADVADAESDGSGDQGAFGGLRRRVVPATLELIYRDSPSAR